MQSAASRSKQSRCSTKPAFTARARYCSEVSEVLRCVGRDAEADRWQADADKYEDWEWFMDQEIPGHIHLWDIGIDLSDRLKEDE